MKITQSNLSQKASDRLAHTDSHLNGFTYKVERIKLLQDRIIAMQSNYEALFLSLQSYAMAKGISSWFHTLDINQIKYWFYNRSKLEYIASNPPYGDGRMDVLIRRVLSSIYFLISDHPELIHWYSHIDQYFDPVAIDNTKSEDFYTQQFFLALRGEWNLLLERYNRLLAEPPTSSRAKKFMVDHHFFAALAKGNEAGMRASIEQLVTPKSIANRIGLESGYSADLLCTPAIIYSKLAWRHGYEIVVDSPYIPKEWLPVQPLDVYEDEFDFMKQYQITAY